MALGARHKIKIKNKNKDKLRRVFILSILSKQNVVKYSLLFSSFSASIIETPLELGKRRINV